MNLHSFNRTSHRTFLIHRIFRGFPAVCLICAAFILASCISGLNQLPDNASDPAELVQESEKEENSEKQAGPSQNEASSEASEPTSQEETPGGNTESQSSGAQEEPGSPSEGPSPLESSLPEEPPKSYILPEGTDIESRFLLPDGYVRTEYPEGSFGSFVRNYPLKPDGSPVLLWTKEPKGNQRDHMAVFAMQVEEELDVQQCADSIMRIYAEYFRASGQYSRIRFHFVSGFLCDYSTYIQGYRVKVEGSEVSWVQSQPAEDSDRVFNEYMKIVCAYASTLSLEGESVEADLHDLQIGDIFLSGGSPGHVVMVADVCEKDGRKAFLLAQGYMPAQEFHIIKNPRHEDDPWYYEEEVQYPFRTQAYTFLEGSFRKLLY